MPAAREQDSMGWMNLVEGRLSREWSIAQYRHYLEVGSSRSVENWASGLGVQLLALVHKMWIARNLVVHARDENGRLLREKESTEEAIEEQFELEFEDLRPQDWHLIEVGRAAVLGKNANEQRAWLHYVRVAREIGENETDLSTVQMRNSLANWLHRGD